MKLSFSARVACIIMYMCRVIPIKKNKIVFSSFFGTKYNDSPRQISEKLSKHNNIEQIWILKKGIEHPHYIKIVTPESFSSLFHLATAKVWVDNSRKRTYIRKRKNQFYIQTWHGGVGFKAVEGGAIETLSERYIESAKNDSRMANIFLSECEWESEQYRKYYWYTGEIMKVGLPRSDKFFEDVEDVVNSVRNELKIHSNQRIALYAPTFRKKGGIEAYDLDCQRLCKTLSYQFGGEWCVVIRLHPEVALKSTLFEYNDTIINGTKYEDINDIVISSDVLISDYSSCIFDALYIGKKVFLYASDYDSYSNNDRHIVFSEDEIPIEFSKNNDELIERIKSFNENEYETNRKRFIEKLGYYSDGHATEKVIDRILMEMENDY